MVVADFQRYGGTVGTHPRDARPELRDVVLTLLQAMDSGQTRPHHAGTAREMNLCPSPGVHSKSDRDDAEFVRGDRSHVASEVAFDGVVEPRGHPESQCGDAKHGALRRTIAGGGHFECGPDRHLEADAARRWRGLRGRRRRQRLSTECHAGNEGRGEKQCQRCGNPYDHPIIMSRALRILPASCDRVSIGVFLSFLEWAGRWLAHSIAVEPVHLTMDRVSNERKNLHRAGEFLVLVAVAPSFSLDVHCAPVPY